MKSFAKDSLHCVHNVHNDILESSHPTIGNYGDEVHIYVPTIKPQQEGKAGTYLYQGPLHTFLDVQESTWRLQAKVKPPASVTPNGPSIPS